jgi:hypothetical protein
MNNKKPQGWTDKDEEGYQRYLEAWRILQMLKPQQPIQKNKRYTPPKPKQ